MSAGPPDPKQGERAPSRSTDKNVELMKAMGSKTGRYDPEPPEQWRWVLAHGQREDRFVAWVKSKTTGHDFDKRSPFCVSEHGTPLRLEHAAVDLGWSLKTTQNVAKLAEHHGRVHLEKGKRIWNRADVPLMGEAPPDEEADETPETLGSWSPYLLDSIRALPTEKRVIFDADEAEAVAYDNAGFAEVVAAWRAHMEPIYDTMFSRSGIEKKRIAKRRELKTSVVQLSFLQVPGFVQGIDTKPRAELNTKPRTNSKNGRHKVAAAPPSLLTLEVEKDLPPSSSPLLEVQVLAEPFGLDDDAASQIIEETRKAAPGEPVAVIVELCRTKAAQLGPHTKNLPGLLLRTVPKTASGAPLARARANAAALAEREARDRERAAHDAPEAPAPPPPVVDQTAWARRCFEDYLKNDYQNFKPAEVERARKIIGEKSKTAGGDG